MKIKKRIYTVFMVMMVVAATFALSAGYIVIDGGNVVTVQAGAKYTKRQAERKLWKYLEKHKLTDEHMATMYESSDDKNYMFRFFNNGNPDMIFTHGWYYVNKKTGKVTPQVIKLDASMYRKNSYDYRYRKKNGLPVVYKAKLKKDKIVVYGSLNGYDHGFSDKTRFYKLSKRSFKLSDAVHYTRQLGDNVDILSKSEFKKYLKKYRYAGTTLGITLTDRMVTQLSISA